MRCVEYASFFFNICLLLYVLGRDWPKRRLIWRTGDTDLELEAMPIQTRTKYIK